MKKVLISLIFIGLFLVQLSLAENVIIESPLKAKTLAEFIKTIIEGLRKIALVLAPLFIIIGGYYLMVAGGNPENITTGKKIILYTIIGLIIIVAAEILINSLLASLGKK